MVTAAAPGQVVLGDYHWQPVAPTTGIIQHQFYVDWNNDGVFSSHEEITADVLAYEHERGRDFASSIAGRSAAGRLQLIVRNETGKYNRYNPASELAGMLEPRRRVQHNLVIDGATYARWGGWLAGAPIPNTANWTATIEALGTLSLLVSKDVEPPASAGALTGALIDVVLDEAQIAEADRVLDAGEITTSRWGIPRMKAFDAMRDLELTELGFVFEDRLGRLVFQDKSSRLTGAALVSQDSYTDDPAGAKWYLDSSEVADPLADVWNEIICHVHHYTVGALAVLWTYAGGSPVLGPAQSISVTALYGSGLDHVSAWTTPVVGTDVTQSGVSNGDIGIVAVKRATSMTITITNNHGSSSATLTLIQARGTPATQEETQVRDENTDSQDRYGPRSLPLEAKFLPDVNAALSHVEALLSRYSEPQPIISLEFALYTTAAAQALALREISERVTVEGLAILTKWGIDQEFFIENIYESCDFAENKVLLRFALSTASGDEGYWILGTSELGVGTKLGY